MTCPLSESRRPKLLKRQETDGVIGGGADFLQAGSLGFESLTAHHFLSTTYVLNLCSENADCIRMGTCFCPSFPSTVSQFGYATVEPPSLLPIRTNADRIACRTNPALLVESELIRR